MTYPMTIAGIKRELPLCKVADDFYIGAFIMFGDAEITVACAKRAAGARAEGEYDYLLTAEAKSIPLIHEMARQSGASKYFVARKGMKVYLTDPIHVQVRSITTQHDQDLYLSGEEAAKMKGKENPHRRRRDFHRREPARVGRAGASGRRRGRRSDGGAFRGRRTEREDIVYLEKLPVFNADSTVKG